MWLKPALEKSDQPAPEQLRYSRYYEHDGALRAYQCARCQRSASPTPSGRRRGSTSTTTSR